jgi:DNA-binding transcriptional LysR family regulator
VQISQLRALKTVAETGSITIAAQHLEISQSGVSHAIAALEKELGVTLIERIRLGVILTEVGQRILEHARMMLEAEELIRQTAASTLGLHSGKLRVGSFLSASNHLMPGILARFKHQYPEIMITMLEGTDAEILEWLEGRAIDVGFAALPAPAQFETVPLIQDDLVAVLPDQHPKANVRDLSLKSISEDAFIMPLCGSETVIRLAYQNANLEPRVAFSVRETSTVISMVREGLGMTVVPKLSLPSDLKGVRVLQLKPRAKRQLALVVRSKDRLCHAAQAFVAVAQHWAAHHAQFSQTFHGSTAKPRA